MELVGGTGHDWYDMTPSGRSRSLFGRGQIIAKNGRYAHVYVDHKAHGRAVTKTNLVCGVPGCCAPALIRVQTVWL